MQSYMNRMDIEHEDDANAVHRVVEAVLKESQREAEKARDALENEVDKTFLEIVLSRYCARILLRRFMNFINQKAKEGFLQRSEARRFLTQAEAQIQKVIADSMMKTEAQLDSGKLPDNLIFDLLLFMK